MGTVISLHYCDDYGWCHDTTNYWAFTNAKDYWSFFHVYFIFFCMWLCHLGTKPRFLGWLFTAMYVLMGGLLWSIIQEISVVAYAAGSVIPPLNTEWLAGDQTFDLLMNVVSALFGLAFFLAVGPIPNTICVPEDNAADKGPTGVIAKVKKLAAKVTRSQWVAWFIWMFLIPLMVTGGAVGIMYIPGISHTSIFRVDFLIFMVYMNVVMLIIFLARGFGMQLHHLTSNLVAVEGEEAFTYTPGAKTLDNPKGLGMSSKEYRWLQTKRRLSAETIQMFVISNVMFLMMLFMYLPQFYFQSLIALLVGVIAMVITRVVMGSEKIQYSYESMRPHIGGYSVTKSHAIGFAKLS